MGSSEPPGNCARRGRTAQRPPRRSPPPPSKLILRKFRLELIFVLSSRPLVNATAGSNSGLLRHLRGVVAQAVLLGMDSLPAVSNRSEEATAEPQSQAN